MNTTYNSISNKSNIKNNNISIKEAVEFTEHEKNIMFSMYKNSYNGGGQKLWFNTKEKLFETYPCVLSYYNLYLTVYVMYQFRKNYNKISLVCHDSTPLGKKLSIDILLRLIKEKGWILEAADKVSWILRKKKAPMLISKQEIMNALDITNEEEIIMNDDFRKDVMYSYQYTKLYEKNENGDYKYMSRETMFGTSPCIYNNKLCGRKCKTTKKSKISISHKTKKNYNSI